MNWQAFFNEYGNTFDEFHNNVINYVMEANVLASLKSMYPGTEIEETVDVWVKTPDKIYFDIERYSCRAICPEGGDGEELFKVDWRYFDEFLCALVIDQCLHKSRLDVVQTNIAVLLLHPLVDLFAEFNEDSGEQIDEQIYEDFKVFFYEIQHDKAEKVQFIDCISNGKTEYWNICKKLFPDAFKTKEAEKSMSELLLSIRKFSIEIMEKYIFLSRRILDLEQAIEFMEWNKHGW